jgi:hypothetical protein
MTTFLVEFYYPTVDRSAVPDLSNLARTLTRQVRDHEPAIRYLNGLLIASEETLMCVFDTDSEEAVRRAAERSKLSVLRITEIAYDPGNE